MGVHVTLKVCLLTDCSETSDPTAYFIPRICYLQLVKIVAAAWLHAETTVKRTDKNKTHCTFILHVQNLSHQWGGERMVKLNQPLAQYLPLLYHFYIISRET